MLRTQEDTLKCYKKYSDYIFKIVYTYLNDREEAKDVVQNTFAKYMVYTREFESENHEKNWLIRVAINECKDKNKHWWNKKRDTDFDISQLAVSENDKEIYKALLSELQKLPDKYKSVLILYYYEGYSSKEIAEILKVKEATVRTHMKRGREILKEKLKGKEVNEIA